MCLIAPGFLCGSCEDPHRRPARGAIALPDGVRGREERAMPVTPHGLSVDAAIALTDEELVCQVYEWIERIDDPHISDALYFLTTEAFERFAPEAEWAEHVRYFATQGKDKQAAAELEATRDGMRRRVAARMIRQALEEADRAG
jgi:hypothetical protein